MRIPKYLQQAVDAQHATVEIGEPNEHGWRSVKVYATKGEVWNVNNEQSIELELSSRKNHGYLNRMEVEDAVSKMLCGTSEVTDEQ